MRNLMYSMKNSLIYWRNKNKEGGRGEENRRKGRLNLKRGKWWKYDRGKEKGD